MFDKSMKYEFKPLTLGVIKEIVKQVDGLVPDDTPVFMDGHSRSEYDPKIMIHRTIERTRESETHFVSVIVLHFGEGDGFGEYDGFVWLKPKVSKQMAWDVTNGIKEVSCGTEV